MSRSFGGCENPPLIKEKQKVNFGGHKKGLKFGLKSSRRRRQLEFGKTKSSWLELGKAGFLLFFRL